MGATIQRPRGGVGRAGHPAIVIAVNEAAGRAIEVHKGFGMDKAAVVNRTALGSVNAAASPPKGIRQTSHPESACPKAGDLTDEARRRIRGRAPIQRSERADLTSLKGRGLIRKGNLI
jgi:hypothetical protein